MNPTSMVAETGRGLFNSYVKSTPQEFAEVLSHIDEQFKKERAGAKDQELSKKLIELFLNAFCVTADARLQVKTFLKDQIDIKVKTVHEQEYLNIKTESSALMVLLWDAKKGEIQETKQEIKQRQELIAKGKAKFKQFKESALTPQQKQALQETSSNALENLKNLPEEIYKKLKSGSYSWDFTSHQLVPVTSKAKHKPVNEVSKAAKDLRLYEITLFVERFFAKEDEAAVQAYLDAKAFKPIKNVFDHSREMYIHYSDGWGGNLHFKVTEKLKDIFQKLQLLSLKNPDEENKGPQQPKAPTPDEGNKGPQQPKSPSPPPVPKGANSKMGADQWKGILLDAAKREADGSHRYIGIKGNLPDGEISLFKNVKEMQAAHFRKMPLTEMVALSSNLLTQAADKASGAQTIKKIADAKSAKLNTLVKKVGRFFLSCFKFICYASLLGIPLGLTIRRFQEQKIKPHEEELRKAYQFSK